MKRTLILALCAAILAGACGDDDPAPVTADASTAASASPAPPAGGGDDGPDRIVSLSPTATEMLFALGAGEQVVAVDRQSDFPAGVPVTDLSGFEPNVEAIATYDPDLVVASGLAPEIRSGLETLDIDVLVLPAAITLDDTYAQLADLGVETGHVDEAAEVVAEIRSGIDEVVAARPERADRLTYYHELDDSLFTATSATFIGSIYALAGLDNVADAADSDGEFGGYPQLSAEFLVDADPDFVFLADTECCGQDATTVAARPGFAGLTAVQEGRVVQLSDDVASRWGPRVVDFLRAIVEAIASVPA
ncbi:MAG: ABC transporter substrate-binding protein [Acidimicrobiia bacterium]